MKYKSNSFSPMLKLDITKVATPSIAGALYVTLFIVVVKLPTVVLSANVNVITALSSAPIVEL